MRSSTPHQAWGQDWPLEWDPGLGPDLPEDGSGFDIGHWEYRWPVGCSRPTELIGGVLVFYGPFDERDLDTARRTYPHHHVVLTEGTLNIEIGQPDPTRTTADPLARTRYFAAHGSFGRTGPTRR